MEYYFNKCVCCLEGDTFKDLWAQYMNDDGEIEIYGEMASECFVLPWQQPADCTEQICTNCITRLKEAYSFRKEVLTSREVLHHLLDRDKETKMDTIKVEDIEPPEESETEMQANKSQVSEGDSKHGGEQHEESQEEADDDVEFLDEYGTCDDEDDEVYLPDDDSEHDENEMKVEFLEDDEEAKTALNQSGTRRYKKYSQIDLNNAVEMVVKNKMTRAEASAVYHVPVKTLGARVRSELDGAPPTGTKEGSYRGRTKPERMKHYENIKSILLASNATPIKGHWGAGYGCCFCREHFRDPLDLKKHTTDCHDRTEKSKFKKGVSALHFKVNLDITNLQCTICDKNLTHLELLMTHLKTEHNVTIHKDIPNQIVPYKFEGEDLECCVCGLEFVYFKLLHEHMNEHYGHYKCDICDRAFVNKANLRVHKYTHANGEFPCQYCDKVFSTNKKQKNHETVIHKKQSKSHKCSYCGERFSCFFSRSKHENSKHGGELIMLKCQSCDATFQSVGNLKDHVDSVHLRLRPHVCEICFRAFPRPLNLRKHAKLHLDRQTNARSVSKPIGKK